MLQVLEKKRRGIFERSDVPININFPNKKGVAGYDPDFPVEELLKDIPKVARQQAKVR